MASREGAQAAFEACDMAKIRGCRPCEVWLYRPIEEGEPKRGPRDLWPMEAMGVDFTLRRAARWYEHGGGMGDDRE